MSAVIVSPSVIAQRKDLPRRFGGLVGWLRGGVGIAASGGKVDSWTDPSTGLQVTAAGGARPTDSTHLGAQCPLFVDTSSTQLVSDITALSAWTILAVSRFGAGDNSQGLWRLGTSGDVVQGYGFIDAWQSYHQVFGAPGRTAQDATIAVDTTYVLGYAASASRTAIFKNGTKANEVLGSAGMSGAKLRLGDIAVAGYYNRGNILDFLLYSGDIGDTAIMAISVYLKSLRGF